VLAGCTAPGPTGDAVTSSTAMASGSQPERPVYEGPLRADLYTIYLFQRNRSVQAAAPYIAEDRMFGNVTVQGVHINSHGPNNDGCDPESCSDVLIKDCYFDTGDDCIAIKSGRNADGRRLKTPTENIIVQDCFMKDGHGGITVGSEISGGVRNLFAENCRLDSPNLDHALRVKNNAMRGGLHEDLHFRNIEVGQVAHAVITIHFNYEEGAQGSFTPVVRNYTVDKLRSGKSQYALDIQGFPSAPITNLRLVNCTFDNVAEGNIVKNVKDATLHDVRINGRIIEALP